MEKYDLAVVGAGIVGLAVAYTAAKQGKKVIVFERHPRAVGASIRNFGLVWPIGQPAGKLFDRAMRSREIWQDVSKASGLWLNENGSLQLAYHDDEWEVVRQFHYDAKFHGYKTRLLTGNEAKLMSPAIKTEGLKGGMFSETECTVTSPQAIQKISEYLEKELQVEFRFGTAITHVDSGVLTDFYDTWRTERIYLCSGADFETLFPQVFRESGITKCKLQMMRTTAQHSGWKLGPSLCAGLTLLHYGAFSYLAEALIDVRNRYQKSNPEFERFGIHVLVSQNLSGEVIIGDSHEYGLDISPFDKEEIYHHILQYLDTFASIPNMNIKEYWHGVYPKLSGATEFVREIKPGIWVVNGLSGAGMTMSFGLAEEVFE